MVVRHGRSTWNSDGRFTGWADPPLDEHGRGQMEDLARRLRREGVRADLTLTSVLGRARSSCELLVDAGVSADAVGDWRLNERHYGELEGRSHRHAVSVYGAAAVRRWRTSWDVRPPPMDLLDPRHPRFDPTYASIPMTELPVGESLADVLPRMLPALVEHALPVLAAGGLVLLVGHANGLRSLRCHLEAWSRTTVEQADVPAGQPRTVPWARLSAAGIAMDVASDGPAASVSPGTPDPDPGAGR